VDWQKNPKTKEEKVFFFIFMFSNEEMDFLGPKKRQKVPK
jgi:hypothetical protein